MGTDKPKIYIVHSMTPELQRYCFYVDSTPSRLDAQAAIKEHDIYGWHDVATAEKYGKYKKLRMTPLTDPPDNSIVSASLALSATSASDVGLGSCRLFHYTGADFIQLMDLP